MPREMTPRLAGALEGLNPAQRRALASMAASDDDAERSGWPALFAALGAEAMILEARDQTILHELAADRSAEVHAIDLRVNGAPPPVEGRPATFDPDTGKWTV